MSNKRAARHAQTRGVKRGLTWLMAVLVAVAVAVALVVILVWVPRTTSSEPHDPATPQQSRHIPTNATDSPGGRQSPSSSDQAAPERAGLGGLRACATRVRRAERAIRAASIGIDHWKRHVQARTDMLTGRISVRRMDAIWEETKAAGAGDQQRFENVLPAHGRLSTCSHQIPGMSTAQRKIAAHCAQRSRTAARALSSAEAAMKDWRVHLSNMAKYAHNKMSSSMAQGRWVKAWRNAPKNISGYRSALAGLDKAPACPRAAS